MQRLFYESPNLPRNATKLITKKKAQRLSDTYQKNDSIKLPLLEDWDFLLLILHPVATSIWSMADVIHFGGAPWNEDYVGCLEPKESTSGARERRRMLELDTHKDAFWKEEIKKCRASR